MQFYDEDILKEFLENYYIGAEITNNQFISTTIGDIYNPDGQIQMLILNGKNGVDLTSFNKEEMEVLYQRGSTFKVINVKKSDGKTYIILEEV